MKNEREPEIHSHLTLPDPHAKSFFALLLVLSFVCLTNTHAMNDRQSRARVIRQQANGEASNTNIVTPRSENTSRSVGALDYQSISNNQESAEINVDASDISMSFWFLLNGQKESRSHLFSRALKIGNQKQFWNIETNAKGQVKFSITTKGNRFSLLSPAGSAQTNLWQHMLVSYDRKAMRVFLNGELIAKKLVSSHISVNRETINQPASFSSEPVSENQVDLSDIRLYSAAITENQISLENPPNKPPVAVIDSQETVNDLDGDGSEIITLSAHLSSDPDGQIISYAWHDSEDILLGDTEIINPVLELGEHRFTLTVTDNAGFIGTAEIIITLEANQSISPELITWVEPVDGSTVSGVVNLLIEVDPESTETRNIQFQVNNEEIGAPISIPPFTTQLDTVNLDDGLHRLGAIANDEKEIISQNDILVTVENNPTATQTECNDGQDNDNDNLIDLEDPGCSNASDTNETDNTFLTTGIVYVRVPRTTGQHVVKLRNGEDYTLNSPDVWDRLPDSRFKFEGFNAPGQLIYRKSDGTETILYDCFQFTEPCVPLDPSVSFDGTKVLFSVYRGRSFGNAFWNGTTLPNRQLREPYEAQLYVADLTNNSVSPLAHTPGNFDVSPIWLTDGRIMFASTRAGTLRPWIERLTPSNKIEPQLYIANADGRNAVNISPHELATAMHPYLLNNGRVIYSSHWLSHNLPFVGTNGGINFFTTVDNLWMVTDINQKGGDVTALLGAHREHTFTDPTNSRFKTFKALHFLGQRENDDICTTNYYRGNNLGLGDIFCWPPEPHGVEGSLPKFIPRNLYNVASWSKSNDEIANKENGLFLGKIGYPEGIENEQLMLTLCNGMCAVVSGTVESFQDDVANEPGKRAVDTGIYKTTKIPSTSIKDLEPIVDLSDWNEFSARVVKSRPAPPDTTNLNNTSNQCITASSDAGTAEADPHFSYEFNNNYRASANHGSKIDGLPHSELWGIRFFEILPNKGPLDFRNSIGNKIRLLGDAPLLADKSFVAQLPCDTPYFMTGIDVDGNTIMRDQIPQSLRPGEERVCTGCHLHSRQGRPYNQSEAFTATPVKLLNSQPVPSFDQDIVPIMNKYCVECHTTDVPVLDYEKLVWDFFQVHVPDVQKIEVRESSNDRLRYGLHRPYTSKYVNTLFARESLLYWKAANKRMDGRTDATYEDDIDFGADHPTDISPADLRTLGLWLDSGALK